MGSSLFTPDKKKWLRVANGIIFIIIVGANCFRLGEGHLRDPLDLNENNYYTLIGSVPLDQGRVVAIIKYPNGAIRATEINGLIGATNGTVVRVVKDADDGKGCDMYTLQGLQ